LATDSAYNLAMRMSFAALLVASVLSTSACKNKAASVDEATQKDLAARRDALMSTRKKLTEDKAKIEAEIKSVESTGGDASGLKKQLLDVTDKQNEVLQSQMNELITKVDNIARPAAGADNSASNAALQAEVSRLEGLITKLEAALKASTAGGGGGADQSKLLAQMTVLSEKCGNATSAVVVQTAAPKGSSYTRAEVEPLLSKARSSMVKKGLLSSDLPGQIQGLESEATKAMSAGDWGRAYLAAAQLSGNVDAIKVDRDFVRNKMGRLNSKMSSAKRDDATNTAMSAGLVEIQDKYGNGDFAAANRKINQLFAQLN
jgi:hypothetical protein